MKKVIRFSASRLVATALLCFATAGITNAEPYLALQKGMQCGTCHSHPAGGGKRNAYGNAYAQTELAARKIGDGNLWTGRMNDWISIGADLRGALSVTDTPGQEDRSEFEINRGTLYAEATLIPGRLSFYVDQQFAPDASQNREAYVRLNSKDRRWFTAAGQFYLPYGLRLQDDTSFVRLATGINFTNPDRGIQFGYSSANWSTIASITNGSGGGREVDSGKQLSVVSTYVQQKWRAGVSANFNDADAGDRTMLGTFAGLKTGPVSWLAEIDYIEDDISPGVSTSAIAGLVEGNLTILDSHNLKISYDYLDPDDTLDEDHQVRYSLVWEHSPMQFLQGRFGIRIYDGVPQNDAQNRKIAFIEIHGFF